MTPRIARNPKAWLLCAVGFIVILTWKAVSFRGYHYQEEQYYQTQGDYLISSPMCHIINLNPWNIDAQKVYEKRDYHACNQDDDILSEIVLDDNKIDVTLRLRPSAVAAKKFENLKCSVTTVTRFQVSDTNTSDISLQVSNAVIMDSSKPLDVSNENPSLVTCTSNNIIVYKNLHQPMALIATVRAKLKHVRQNERRHLSVLVLGIDSISRLNMIRTLSHTYNHLRADPAWLEFKIFQKMGDNTFPNVMALLTGYNKSQAIEICKPYELNGLSDCDILWKRYAARHFVTIFSEDYAKISTFNFEKNGFNAAPTDYYMRAYHLACADFLEKVYIDGNQFCSGLVAEGERVWDLAVDFSRLHRKNPHFGLFWTNSYSHEDVNTPGRMDDKVREYLDVIVDNVDENTVIIFLSDHGIRFGPIRQTLTGYLEERLPFLFIRFPSWFSTSYPREFAALAQNTERMVTPYDLYMTLQQILRINDPSYKVQPALGCPKCGSLFEPISINRSCDDANVTEHWCTCSNMQRIGISKVVRDAADVTISKLNAMIAEIDEFQLCSAFELDQILDVYQATNDYGGKADLIVIQFQTLPLAKFEASIHTGNMVLYGGFSRSDSYKATSDCTDNPALKMFCYCKAAQNLGR